MDKIILFVSTLLVCLSCFISSTNAASEHRTFTMFIDTTFTPTEFSAIQKAAHLWERATNGRVSFKFIPKESEFDAFELLNHNISNTIIRADENDPGLFFFEMIMVGGQILGLAPPGEYMILVPNRMESEKEMVSVAAHEFGHWIGLAHTPSIMDSSSDSSSKIDCITKYDLLQFCTKYQCNYTTETIPVCETESFQNYSILIE